MTVSNDLELLRMTYNASKRTKKKKMNFRKKKFKKQNKSNHKHIF